MQETYDGIWREIASRIRLHISADAFRRWFAAIELVQADEMALILQVFLHSTTHRSSAMN